MTAGGGTNHELRRRFVSGALWGIIGRVLSNLLGFVIFALLARFLAPYEFGLVAFAAVFTELIRTFAYAGLPQALIQRAAWDDGVASSAYWVNLGLASLLAILVAGGLGPLLAVTYDPVLGRVMPLLALTLVIDAARAVHEAKLQRDFSYRSMAQRTMIGTIAGGLAGVALAAGGFGLWSLVASRLVTAVVQTAAVWRAARWRPQRRLARGEVRPLLAFGLHLSLASFLDQVTMRTPDLIIGIVLGPAAVGFYRVGARAVQMLNDSAIEPTVVAALSAFSRIGGGAMAETYRRTVRIAAVLTLPIYLGAAVIAQDFVTLCFGARWAASGTVMMLLALGGIGAAVIAFAAPTAAAAGRSKLVGAISLTLFGATLALTLGSVWLGLAAVAGALILRQVLVLPVVLWALRRASGLRAGSMLPDLLPPLLAAAAMALLLALLRETLLAALAPLLRLAFTVVAGGALYPLLLALLARRQLLSLIDEARAIIFRAPS